MSKTVKRKVELQKPSSSSKSRLSVFQRLGTKKSKSLVSTNKSNRVKLTVKDKKYICLHKIVAFIQKKNYIEFSMKHSTLLTRFWTFILVLIGFCYCNFVSLFLSFFLPSSFPLHFFCYSFFLLCFFFSCFFFVYAH